MRLIDRIEINAVYIDESGREAVFTAATKAWMANSGGVTHGGISGALCDYCMRFLVSRFFDVNDPILEALQIYYQRPVRLDDEVVIHCRTIGEEAGRFACRIEGRMKGEAAEHVCFTATGVLR